MSEEKKSRSKARIVVGSLLMATIFCCVFLVNFVQAQQVDTGLNYATEIGLSDQDIRITIAKIIRIFIGFLGVIALVLIIYAGWLWMSSNGNAEKISQANKIIKNAIIGLIIILSSFAIVSFVLSSLVDSGGGSRVDSGGGPGGGGAGGSLSALGSGIIESHYPARNATNIVRNTKIVVTFKEAMDPGTIITAGSINPANIKIFLTKDGASGPYVTDVLVNKTDDNKIFIFMPRQYLGSPSEKMWYTVALSKDLKKANGQAAFTGSMTATGYSWSFEVSTLIDATPPKINSIIPMPSSTEPRNVVIQINFNEAVDPSSASGASANFDNIVISTVSPIERVSGTFYLSNQYQTVEFLTNDTCGTNSCGNTVYCLPGDKNISALIKAATLLSVGSSASDFPYDGVVDMANNSFDGNSDGTALGPKAQSGKEPFNANNNNHDNEGDDYLWSFNTNNTIDISAPTIFSTDPAIRQNGVELSALVQAVFSKLLMSSSINTNSVYLSRIAGSPINYWVGNANEENPAGKKITIIKIYHDIFSDQADYQAGINVGLRDIYQNCFSPCSGGSCNGNPSCCDGTSSTHDTCQ